MAQVLTNTNTAGKWSISSTHAANQQVLESIIADIPHRQLVLPQILISLEQIYSLMVATSEHSLPTGLHLGRVGRLGRLLATKVGLSWEENLECLYGGWIHDVGKMYIPEDILNKPGKLTREEFAIIKQHVDFGCQVLADYPHLEPFLKPVKYHHERWDGNGYPHKLKGLDIPVTGRITGLVDAYDAMTSFRPYPPYQRTHEEAIAEIRRCAGCHFDPYLSEIFCNEITLEEIETTIL